MSRKKQKSEGLELKRSKGKFMTIAALFPISLYAVVLKMLELERNSIWFYILLAISALLILAIYNAVRQILNRKAALSINSEGIIDDISPAKAGVVKWAEVSSFEVKKYLKRDHLLIYINEPKKVLTGKKKLAEIMLEELGTPIAISLELLKEKPEVILKAMEKNFKRSKRPTSRPE